MSATQANVSQGTAITRLAEWTIALFVTAGAWYINCQVLSTRVESAMSLATMLNLVVTAIPLSLLVTILALCWPSEIRDAVRASRASRRYLNMRCPACDHSRPPTSFDGLCCECGAPFRPPEPPARRVTERFMLYLLALGVAAAAALAWHATDLASFHAEVAKNPRETFARPRFWPAKSAGFTYSPERGVRAHD